MNEIIYVPLPQITESTVQIRKERDETHITELMQTMKTIGVITPIIVRRKGRGIYEIVDGGERYRAAIRAGISELQCIVIDCDDGEASEVGFIANIQRRALTAYDRAKWIEHMLKNFPDRYQTQKVLARRLGKPESWISEHLAILELEKDGTRGLGDLKKLGHKISGDLRAIPRDQRAEVISQIGESDKVTRKKIAKVKKTISQKKFLCTHCDGGTRIVTRNECNQTLLGLLHSLCNHIVEPLTDDPPSIDFQIPLTIAPKPMITSDDIIKLRGAIAIAIQNKDLPPGVIWHGKVPTKYDPSMCVWPRQKLCLFIEDSRNQTVDPQMIDDALTTRGFFVVRRVFEPPLSDQTSEEVVDALKEAYTLKISSEEML